MVGSEQDADLTKTVKPLLRGVNPGRDALTLQLIHQGLGRLSIDKGSQLNSSAHGKIANIGITDNLTGHRQGLIPSVISHNIVIG